MAHHGCPPCGRRDVREWAEVCAAGDDAGRDLVVLGDHVRDDHVDVRKGPVRAGDVVADSGSPCSTRRTPANSTWPASRCRRWPASGWVFPSRSCSASPACSGSTHGRHPTCPASRRDARCRDKTDNSGHAGPLILEAGRRRAVCLARLPVPGQPIRARNLLNSAAICSPASSCTKCDAWAAERSGDILNWPFQNVKGWSSHGTAEGL